MADLNAIIEETISKELRHQDYDRVTGLSDKYKAFIINKPDKDGNYPLNDYLRQFVRREDDDLFEQRKNLTKQYVPSICSQIMRTFQKVVRSNRVTKIIDHKEKAKTEEIIEKLDMFYGESEDNGIDQYMKERFFPLSFTDPNAWIRVTFDEFDANKEKPQPYPEEFSSYSIINFEVKNDQTQWTIAKLEYDYLSKNDDWKTSNRFLIFGPDVAIEYKLIPKDIKESFAEDGDTIWADPKKPENKYVVYTYDHKSEKVPMMRVGYVKDISTKSRTYVNPFDYEAMPLLEQFLKVSSELQLSITLHAFPKQVSYIDQCDARGCNGGLLADGKQCESCEGSGKKVHTTSADIMEIPMPKRPEDMVDISKISAYVPFPGGVMEFLDGYSEKLEKKVLRMVFSTESLVQTQFNTATEAEIDVDSVYDTLAPFASKYSDMWMFIVKLSILYMSYDGVTVYHKFPSDFKLKPLSKLLDELKKANDSNAPSYIRESINNDIADIIYADDQDERAKLSIKNRHFPFSGKTDFEIQNIILNNLTTREKQILYANFDSIFDELEDEFTDFYSFTFRKQKDHIDAKIAEILKALAPNALDLNTET